MELVREEFTWMKGNMRIVGVSYAPNDQKLPPMIICHGFTADLRSTEHYAKHIAELGYRTFVFDFCGGGFETKSDGSFHDYMTPMTEVDDLKAVIEYVSNRDDVEIEHLCLMGCSQGGFVTSIVAAELKSKVDKLILFYPALCIPDDARKGSMQIMSFDPNNIPHHIGEGRMVVCGAYPRSVQYMDIFEVMKEYKGKVLLVHGTEDHIVPIAYSEKAHQTYLDNGTEVIYQTIEGAGHGFSKNYCKEAYAILDEYLKEDR